MAAPKKNESEKYQKYIRVKLLDDEHNQLKKLVSESGNTISEIIRELIENQASHPFRDISTRHLPEPK